MFLINILNPVYKNFNPALYDIESNGEDRRLETGIPEGLRNVLWNQTERRSPGPTQILIWLAILDERKLDISSILCPYIWSG
jgi:hypothetical protein